MDKEPFNRLTDEPDLALRLIMEKHGEQLTKWIRNFIPHNDELVKDAVQETLIVLWSDADKVATAKDPFMWMMVIAKNVSLSKLRREHQDRRVPLEEIENLSCNIQADTELNYKDTVDDIVLKASKLTSREQEILIGSKLHGMENKELEKKHGLAPQRVRNLLSSGLKKIRQLLKD